MKRIIQTRRININCKGAVCGNDWIAYVYPKDGKYEVFFCPLFWTRAEGNTFKGKANSIVHELAHEVQMSNPNIVLDKEAPWKPNTQPMYAPYELPYTEWIAVHDAWTAISNAENYAAYLSNA